MRSGIFTPIITIIVLASLAAAACGDDGQDGAGAQTEHGVLTVDRAVAAVHVPCLDVTRDFALTADDAGQILAGGAETSAFNVDFNADGAMDERDSAFVATDLAISPEFDHNVCAEEPPIEFLVSAREVPAIDCAADEPALIVVGVAGGVVDLRTRDNAAGVRWIVNGLLDELEDEGVQALAVIAGPGLPGIDDDLNAAMENWLTHSVRLLLEQYDCADAVFLGHSHGAISADVVSARIEGDFGERMLLVVPIDRIEALYMGDLASRPQQVPVLNIYETNDADQSGAPRDGANVENGDASGEEAPAEGEGGGPNEPVNHTTIDNSPGVRDRIIEEVMDRLP